MMNNGFSRAETCQIMEPVHSNSQGNVHGGELMKIMDTTAGFKCYRRDVLLNINPGHIRLVGYGFQIEMKFTAWRLGYKILEVPIIFTDRRAGTSKMSGSIFGEAMWGVLRMKISSFFRKPRRIVT